MSEADQLTVYEPDQRVRMGVLSCWRTMIGNVVRSRELIWQLFKRDFLAGSKQSMLGLLWVLFSPLVGIVSWVLMNYAGVLQPGDTEVPYPLYVLFGSTMWGMFMGSYSAAAASLTSGGSLMLQVKFSHEALVAQQMAQTAIAVVANLVLLALVSAVFGALPQWAAIFFPLSLVPLIMLGTGVGMFVSVLAVVVRDVTKIVGTVLGFLMFLTPVIYAPGVQNEWLQRLIWWNPLTYLVSGARDLALHGRIDHLSGYAGSVVLSMAIFLLSWRLFFLSEQKVAEKF